MSHKPLETPERPEIPTFEIPDVPPFSLLGEGTGIGLSILGVILAIRLVGWRAEGAVPPKLLLSLVFYLLSTTQVMWRKRL